jgi:hypothetical protein
MKSWKTNTYNWKNVHKGLSTTKVVFLLPTAPPNMFTMKKESIYKLILGFQHCQVGRVRSFALEHAFSSADGRKCDRSHYMWDRAQMLQNLLNLVKYEFVDLQVSFSMTPRSLQSEFYNSRYGRFGETRRVRIIAQLKFASNAPRTASSPKINVVSPRCTLTTCKTLKHQN